MSAPIQVKTLLPLDDQIVVRADAVQQKTTTDSGFHLPDTAQRIEVKRTGTVVSVGPLAIRAVPGMRVLFSAFAGTEIDVDGEILDMMQDCKVLAQIS